MKDFCWALAIAPLVFAGSQANAQIADAPTSSPQTEPAPAPEKAPVRSVSPSRSPIMSMAELDDMRGGEQSAVNTQTFYSENSGNTIGGDFTAGDVSLSDNALSSFSGLGNIVINTGAQSALQAGIGVTINITD